MFTLLEICEPRWEMDAYTYFRWRFNNWGIEFSRHRDGLFAFRIDLPFIHINNVVSTTQEVTEVADPGTDYGVRYIRTIHQVISGKILWWKIKI